MSELTRAIPFNDADVLERVLDDVGDRVAALILEPAMMNITIVAPRPGYLERIRELTARHGVMLVFDEVKTGMTIAAGGAVERFGVRPDIVCLAKAIAGGYPSGAVGMTEPLADLITTGRVRQVGTFNGNPLSMAAAQAALTEVLTDDAYASLNPKAKSYESIKRLSDSEILTLALLQQLRGARSAPGGGFLGGRCCGR